MLGIVRRIQPHISAAYCLQLLWVFVLYFTAGKLGLSAPFTSGNVSPFWPAAGIALASVLLWGYRVWPAIALAAFLVNFWSPIPFPASVGIGIGNTSAALLGGFLLRRFGALDLGLSRLRDLIAFLFLGAVISPIVAASIGTTTLLLTHVAAWSGLRTALAVWWSGDGMGVLIVTPLFLTVREATASFDRSRGLEALGLLTGTAVTALLVFSRVPGHMAQDDVLAFAVFPFVIWAAIKFRIIGVEVICLLIALVAVWGTSRGQGPFIRHDPVHNAILLQLFLDVLSVSGLLLAAVISERTRAEDALRKLSGRLMQLQDDERRRLARELHDSSGQHLVALQMNLSMLRNKGVQLDQGSSELLADSEEMLERAVKEIRTLSYLLYPPLLDEAGLSSALQWYVDGLAQRGTLKLALHIAPELGRLSRELETTIFRIVQECLTNIHRHSQSTVAEVAIYRENNKIMVTVRDEGKGPPAELLRYASGNLDVFGVGMRGIAERVRELGGQLRIRNAMPGMLVEVKLPYSKDEAASDHTALLRKAHKRAT